MIILTKDSELRKLAREAIKKNDLDEVKRLYLLSDSYKRRKELELKRLSDEALERGDVNESFRLFTLSNAFKRFTRARKREGLNCSATKSDAN